VLKALGIKIDAIPHENASRRGPYPDYYDDESREMIASLYAADIEAFGYSFGEKVGPLVNLAPSR
jgi:hypothetical protein